MPGTATRAVPPPRPGPPPRTPRTSDLPTTGGAAPLSTTSGPTTPTFDHLGFDDPGSTHGSATADEDAPDPDIARVAADAERALADAAKEAEKAVAEAHDDGQDAVRKNYDDARRAAEEAYEQSSARTDPQE